MTYAIVIEKGQHNYAAYVPDLPGCTTSGTTVEEVRENMKEAMLLYIEALRSQGSPIPEPTTRVVELDVA